MTRHVRLLIYETENPDWLEATLAKSLPEGTTPLCSLGSITVLNFDQPIERLDERPQGGSKEFFSQVDASTQSKER